LDASPVTAFIAAAAQYPISQLRDWDDYAAKLTLWVEQAAQQGARLAVFPEYGAMELASLDPASMGDLAGSLASVSAWLPRVDALHRDLAMRLGLHILAASAPCQTSDGRYVNRARLFAPYGGVAWQDKLIMTRFEREQWGMSSGGKLRLFDTDLGRIGIIICYDSEFPLIARAMVGLAPNCCWCPVAPIPRMAIGGCGWARRRGRWKGNAIQSSRPPWARRHGRPPWM